MARSGREPRARGHATHVAVWVFLLPALAAAASPRPGEPQPLVFSEAPPLDWVGCPLQSFELAMVGDVMLHQAQLAAARQPDGTHRFDGVFDPVAPWLRASDLVVANLETVLGGADLGGFTGYPTFNSPASILTALREAGVDVLQTANNHSLDRGVVGVQRTLDAVDAAGLLHAGTWRTREARARPWVIATLPGGLDVAFVASTFSTNDIPLPRGQAWMVSRTTDGQLEAEVAAARASADLVVVGVHWGTEYQDRPASAEIRLARRLVAAGADIVMGTHPHVLQPAEVIRVADTLGRPREAVVFYSLGNFVSNQRRPHTHGAVIARVRVLRCEGTDRAWVADARVTPFWVDTTLAGARHAYRVVPTPPLGATTCHDPDLDALDCRSATAFRDHAAEMFTPGQLSWTVGGPQPLPLGFDWTAAGRWQFPLPEAARGATADPAAD